MLHEDTVFTDVAKSSQWRGVEYPVISKEELDYCLSFCEYDVNTRDFKLPPLEKINELQNTLKTLAWKERQSVEFILSSFKEKFEINKVSYYYQEYLHILSSPDDELYKDHKVFFADISVGTEFNNNYVEFEWDTYLWKGFINLCIGVDLASSERESSDDTCILVGGWAHLYPIITGYDMLSAQDIHPYKRNGIALPVIIDGFMGKADVYDDKVSNKRGVVNIINDFCDKYKINEVTIETNAQQALIYREVKKYLKDTHPKVLVKGEISTIKKEEAINSVLMPIFQSSKKVIFRKSQLFYTVWSQLKHLGVAKHDDGADALKTLFINAKKVKNPIDLQQINPSKKVSKVNSFNPDWICY
jgi:hypothetical protein